MCIDPDGCIAKQHFTVSVCVGAFVLMYTAELFHGFIDGHCVWQNVVTNQQFNAVPTTAVRYRHCSLTATTAKFF